MMHGTCSVKIPVSSCFKPTVLPYTNYFNAGKRKDFKKFFLGAFAKLLRPTIKIVISVSVRPFIRMEQIDSHWTDFDEFFSQIHREIRQE